jgi:hypothetical protein
VVCDEIRKRHENFVMDHKVFLVPSEFWSFSRGFVALSSYEVL